jgi:MoxR-like ATPase
MARVQFTPDLMPADVVGASVFDSAGSRFELHRGPNFTDILLADEINRTPPKTQAALLEAMQEFQVTVGGVRYPLARPLFVLATQNPIEQEGTHPLPEAQLDRFMFNVVIDYPGLDEERRILAETTSGAVATVRAVATGAQLEAARSLVRDLPAADNVVSFALRLVRGTRPADETAPAVVREWIKWGAGPRAGQALLLGAKALALIDGRSVPSPEDVRAIAAPVLRHRLLLNFQAEADGIDTDHVVTRLLEQIAP